MVQNKKQTSGFHSRCRVCNSKKMTKFLDLGFSPLADAFLFPEQLREPETYYPLEVFICDNCSLIQLGYVVSPKTLFQQNYPYDMSVTQAGAQHFYSLGKYIASRFDLRSKDLIVDIGSNTGVLLSGFKAEGFKVLGVEPAPEICKIAQRNGIETLNDFFSLETAHKIVKKKGQAKVITATNVFAHVNDLHSFVKGVETLLADKGIFMIEAPYLLDLIEKLEYDTIYHEHLSYLSVKPLIELFNQFEMRIFDIERLSIHGGSLRYFIARDGDYPISNSVNNLVKLEKRKKLYEMATLNNFADLVRKNAAELTWMLRSLKRKCKRIAGVSASAKSTTLLNYCRIGPELLDFVTEKSPLKIGKYTPGTHIPIVPDEKLFEEIPEYALLLAWNFAESIMKKLSKYKEAGGKFIIPIPEPHIVDQ